MRCTFNSDVLRGCCQADHTPMVTLCGVQWLTILPEDDEKTRTKKKKLIKSYKSKMRFAKLDQETKVGVHAIDSVKRWHGLERGGCSGSLTYECILKYANLHAAGPAVVVAELPEGQGY